MTRTRRPPQCPNCHSTDEVLEILWGMPSEEDFNRNYWIGGCCVPERPWPKWHCEHCDHEWR